MAFFLRGFCGGAFGLAAAASRSRRIQLKARRSTVLRDVVIALPQSQLGQPLVLAFHRTCDRRNYPRDCLPGLRPSFALSASGKRLMFDFLGFEPVRQASVFTAEIVQRDNPKTVFARTTESSVRKPA